MKCVKSFKIFLAFGICLWLVGCATTSKKMMSISASSLEARQLETRYYESKKDLEILSASVATLQDLGFQIDEINRDFGVITSSKSRDAREAGQQTGVFLMAILFGANMSMLADHTQTIKATVVVTQVKDKSYVRLTIQRILYNNQGIVNGVETIKEPEIYSSFFEKLSQAIFLEANNL
ncbi:hypothetical protein [Campylobacter cuniculorum]|uniref:Lipoprotein n=2 Tax=Campylobacter cuniculorum TaxID=374106 RepID=A0A1W6BX78_9BACT|nr:hypothetical protein [Campylobacter cuniculorum]ARJ56713.1 hypothetical protein CCUN_1116 [Campylobacter cuniculorum DSM 23162 = LMG 24588]QOR04184.1 hypothetical protein A0071_08480 [Campylobacter cuniculorum]